MTRRETNKTASEPGNPGAVFAALRFNQLTARNPGWLKAKMVAEKTPWTAHTAV